MTLPALPYLNSRPTSSKRLAKHFDLRQKADIPLQTYVSVAGLAWVVVPIKSASKIKGVDKRLDRHDRASDRNVVNKVVD